MYDLSVCEMKLCKDENPTHIVHNLNTRFGKESVPSKRGGFYFNWRGTKETLEKNNDLGPNSFDTIPCVIGRTFFLSWLFKRLRSEFNYDRYAPYSIPKKLDPKPKKLEFENKYVDDILKALTPFFDSSDHLQLQQLIEDTSYTVTQKLYFNSNQNQLVDFFKRCIRLGSNILIVEKNEILTEWILANFKYNKKGAKSPFSASTVQRQLDDKYFINSPKIESITKIT